jgi:hypothetical protein
MLPNRRHKYPLDLSVSLKIRLEIFGQKHEILEISRVKDLTDAALSNS